MTLELSVVILTLNDTAHLNLMLKGVQETLARLAVPSEIVVVNRDSQEATVALAQAIGATVLTVAPQAGYGEALRHGLQAARGQYVLTMDADLAQPAALLPAMWQARQTHEIVVASRYILGGRAEVPWERRWASGGLNRFLARGLSLPIHDLSSGFRLYSRAVLQSLPPLHAHSFDILLEIAVLAFAQGWRFTEVPFIYRSTAQQRSVQQALRVGGNFFQTFGRMWRLRNSIASADYDDRAHDSVIPLQMYWQRTRYNIITRFAANAGFILDIGCGSSRMIPALAPMVGLDILLPKLRYGRRFGQPLVNGSIWALPFGNAQFDCVVCSEVIEHIPGGMLPFEEIHRVLKPGGRLVIGTPDYGPPYWRAFEAAYKIAAPGGYADEHITHYTFQSLRTLLESLGFQIQRWDYILGSEMIFECTKLPAPRPLPAGKATFSAVDA